jgi:hypothetical protein
MSKQYLVTNVVTRFVFHYNNMHKQVMIIKRMKQVMYLVKLIDKICSEISKPCK